MGTTTPYPKCKVSESRTHTRHRTHDTTPHTMRTRKKESRPSIHSSNALGARAHPRHGTLRDRPGISLNRVVCSAQSMAVYREALAHSPVSATSSHTRTCTIIACTGVACTTRAATRRGNMQHALVGASRTHWRSRDERMYLWRSEVIRGWHDQKWRSEVPSAVERSEVALVHLGVLACELEQHRVVEELVDRDVLREALAAARLDHKLAREVRRRLRLERPQRDVLVERVARHDGPVVEGGEAEGLALRVRAQVGLEAKGVDDGHEGLEQRERRAWARALGHDVAAPPAKDRVDSGDGVGGRLDLD
mmetsp:Transcript_63504/g.189221  ORF Transcript_63504/g.189221 Transcript_63504/m.189221 type:complete len:307 (-) Transcript_63504:2480-3400(-)